VTNRRAKRIAAGGDWERHPSGDGREYEVVYVVSSNDTVLAFIDNSLRVMK